MDEIKNEIIDAVENIEFDDAITIDPEDEDRITDALDELADGDIKKAMTIAGYGASFVAGYVANEVNLFKKIHLKEKIQKRKYERCKKYIDKIDNPEVEDDEKAEEMTEEKIQKLEPKIERKKKK